MNRKSIEEMLNSENDCLMDLIYIVKALQREIKHLNLQLDQALKDYDELQEENENLKDFNTKLQATKDRLDKYDRENQMRIDKAIEYIKTVNESSKYLDSMFLYENYISNYGACELLDILQGDDKE